MSGYCHDCGNQLCICEELKMNKRYDYCCKHCWYTWRHINKYKICPKCGSSDVDIQSEVVL